jgi:hypothetical protein
MESTASVASGARHHYCGRPDRRLPLVAVTRELAASARAINLQLTRLARQHFLNGWISQAPGIGLGGLARLMAVTGPLDRFATVSKLWAYVGMHVDDGMAPQLRRGQRANWSSQGRVVCHQLATSIVRVGRGRYREAYDRKKAEYLARRGSGRQHAHSARRTRRGRARSSRVDWRMRTSPRCDTPRNCCCGICG